MNLFTWIFGSARETHIEQLAETLAARSVHATIERLSFQIQGMGLNEAQGYIRARAGLIVGREVAAAHRDSSLAAIMEATSDFSERVMVATIRRVQSELQRRRTQPMPLRRAA